ncbi:hypothetical protein GCM10028804_12400 [Larkinella terrae]
MSYGFLVSVYGKVLLSADWLFKKERVSHRNHILKTVNLVNTLEQTQLTVGNLLVFQQPFFAA